MPSARKLVLNFVGFALKPKKVVFPLGKLLFRSHLDWHIPPSPSAYFQLVLLPVMKESRGSRAAVEHVGKCSFSATSYPSGERGSFWEEAL